MVDENAVAFVEIDAPIVNGKPSSISFVRRKERIPDELLQAPERIGKLTVRFVNADFNKAVETSFPWLPDPGIYAGSQGQTKLREGLASLDFHGPDLT